MPRKLSFPAIRDGVPRAIRWLGFVLIGIVGGTLLGEMAVGTRLGGGGGDAPASYSQLSANPGALAPPGEGAIPVSCPGCVDSYGVAARLRADREDRMDDGFRDLGAVDIDAPLPAEPADDGYRYGGRFPDPPPREEYPVAERAAATATPADVPVEEARTPAGEE
ncbi:MAG: hypothetical protein J7499_19220 [Sphingopyxis sp.]|nr:hypothetical protein [Sphingopyxis sp.]